MDRLDVGARATSAVAVRVDVVRETAGTAAMTAAAYRVEAAREAAAKVVGSAAREAARWREPSAFKNRTAGGVPNGGVPN